MINLRLYNITINPVGLAGAARNQYIRQVHEHLNWIHLTKSGRILLNCIRRPTFPIEIRPHTTAKCDAVGGGENRPGVPGLAGVITYTPFAFSSAGSCSALPVDQNRGRIWDEILFHEMVHVFRNATGKWNKAPRLSINMNQYDDNEEFIAVMCTNIYISDHTNRIKSGLRAGHKDFSAMSADEARRFGLFASSKAAYSLVKQFCDDHPIFSKALSDQLADVEYNPIADFYRFPKVCELFSSYFGLAKDYTKWLNILTASGLSRAVAEVVARQMAAV